jgi:uncharacterized protein (TIGR03435 family)
MQLIGRALIAVFISLVRLHGQSFDVASIRPHDPANTMFVVRMPAGGQFTAVGAPLKLLVMLANRVQESQIVGGPGWFATEKWDIAAQCDDRRHSTDETYVMLQHLLKERFSLQIHSETQQRPVYFLTVGKGGPKLKKSEKNTTNVRSGAHSISIDRGNIANLTRVLATAVGRPIIDHTALTDLYDISILWDDAPVQDAAVPGAKQPASADVSVGGEGHGSIFSALQEQLGLRLEPTRAPVDVLVVDGAERAAAN